MKIFGKKSAKTVLASLSHDGVDQLCDLIIARLEERTQTVLASQAEGRGSEELASIKLNICLFCYLNAQTDGLFDVHKKAR